MKTALRILTTLILVSGVTSATNALAACSNPTGVEGQIVFNDTHNTPQYCDNTNWIAMTGGDPSLTNPNSSLTQIVPDDLVGHWRLDETSGTTIFDSSGNGYDGTITNFTLPATTSNGVIDQGIAFSGFDTRIESPTGFPTGANQPFSISMWVNPDQDTQDGTFFFTDGASNEMVMRTDGNSNALRFSLPNNTVFSAALNLPENFGKWTLITATSDGTTMNLYKNSVLIDTEALSAYTLTATSFGVGDRHGGSSNEAKDGIYDDVRFYDRAITADEIAEIYAARDGIRYNESHRTPEYFDGNKFVSLRPAFPEVGNAPIQVLPIAGCPNIGDVCDDGSVYAGLSTDGDIPMYTTPTDGPSGISWDDGDINRNVNVGATDRNAGAANTALIVSTDADSALAGFQDHNAAKYCNDLSAHGSTDWYLPAIEELLVMYPNRVALGGFSESHFWSSNDDGFFNALLVRTSDGIEVPLSKANVARGTRCVRKQNFNLVSAGLVGHWKLDETSGTTAFDSSGNGNDGTMLAGLEGASNTQRGTIGNSLYFRAIPVSGGDAIQLPNSNTLITNNINWTASVWFNAPSIAAVDIEDVALRLGSALGDGFFMGIGGNNKLQFRYDNGISFSTVDVATVTTDRWYHYVASYDGGTYKLYLDGVEELTVTDAFSGFDASDAFIGRGNSNNGLFQGLIDDVRIYDRTLTNDEISQLYAIGSPIGTSTALPLGCPNIGDVCDDGTVYVGTHDNGELVFTTTDYTENSLPWNNGNTSGFVAIPTTSINNGKDNTDLIITTDSDSVTAGFQPHQGAQHCYDLNKNGADDWFLPDFILARFICNNSSIIPNASSGFMASSDTGSPDSSYDGVFPACNSGNFAKQFFNSIRCVRQGPAPRCANPYGVEGQMIYNSTHDIVQYCDGARWIGLGKDN